MLPAIERRLKYFELAPGRAPAREDIQDIRDATTRQRVNLRLQRARQGNYGVHRRFGDFLELILDFGPGYRLYLGEDGPLLLILLVVGDKSTQTADFREAHANWEAFKARKQKGGPR